MLHWINELVTASPVTYLVIVGVVAIDAFFPIMPGETVVIGAAVLAASGQLSLGLVIASAIVAVIIGDNISYLLGHLLGRPVARRLFRGEASRRRLAWAARQLRQRGAMVIIVARVLPGVRTATTFSAGMLEMPWRRFFVYDLAAAVAWGPNGVLFGYLGGQAFAHSFWKPMLLSLGGAAVVGAVAHFLVLRRMGSPDDVVLRPGEDPLAAGATPPEPRPARPAPAPRTPARPQEAAG